MNDDRQPPVERPKRPGRQQILATAMELFAKEGSRGTSLAAIAERLGVTPPAITHHFGTKRALLMEVVEEADKLTFATWRPTGVNSLERLVANREWADILAGDPAFANLFRLVIVMIAESLDPEFPAHAHFVTRQRQFRQLLVDMVVAGQDEGSIRSDLDPKLVATQVMAFMQGAQLQWLLDPEEVPIQRVFQAYFDQLKREITPGRRQARSGRHIDGHQPVPSRL